jgi:hypothetical protein
MLLLLLTTPYNLFSQVIVGWNPEAFYAMIGERTRKSMEDPATRINNRQLMQPGFNKEALAGYMDKVITFNRLYLKMTDNVIVSGIFGVHACANSMCAELALLCSCCPAVACSSLMFALLSWINGQHMWLLQTCCSLQKT